MGNTESVAGADAVSIVMVHGVGDAKPGAILAEFCSSLKNQSARAHFHAEKWFIGKLPYARLVGEGVRVGGRAVKELIEVNWADVMRPGEGKLGAISHLIMLFFALRNLSLDEKANPSPIARGLARFHWAVLELFSLWAAFCVMAGMVLVSFHETLWQSIAVIIGAALAMIGVAEAAARTGRPRYRCGWLWALGFSIVSACYLSHEPGWRHGFVTGSADLYQFSQALVTVSLTLAFFSAVFAGKGSPSQRAARGGFLWLPFILITSLLVLLWLTLLGLCHKEPDPRLLHLGDSGYQAWQNLFASGLHYNMKVAEEAMMGAQVFIFLVVPLIGLATYFNASFRAAFFTFFRPICRFPTTPGEAAHSMLQIFLMAGPAALLVAVIFMGIYWHHNLPADNSNIFEIYKLSALRLPALLTFLVPGIRTVSDIIGDVLFHIQPEHSEVSSRAATGERMKAVLAALKSDAPEVPVIVLAHSQGSMQAWTLLRTQPDMARLLATAGCPLSTLYERFLGPEFQRPLELKTAWHNFFRDGDYVGGPVNDCPENEGLGAGPHTGYFADQTFADRFDACVAKHLGPPRA